MKLVLVIQKPQARGQEIFASQLGNELIGLGHEVTMISLFSGNFDLPFLGKHISMAFAGNKSIRSIIQWKIFSDYIRDIKPDIVQTNGGDTLKFTVLARMFFYFPCKLVHNNGGVVGYYLRSALQLNFYRFLLRKVNGAISVSKYSMRDLSNLIPKEIPQIHIPIGIPMEVEIKKSKAISKPIFVHLAGFTREKNHRYLLEIFIEFLHEFPNAELRLFGDGPLFQEIKSSFSNQAAIKFFGELVNPWLKIPENAVMLLPSLIEGMPAVIAEAFFAKIPIVAHGVGGIPEMAKGMFSCTIVTNGDKQAFINGMKYWIQSDKITIEARLTASKNLVRERFDLKNICQDFIEFYEKL